MSIEDQHVLDTGAHQRIADIEDVLAKDLRSHRKGADVCHPVLGYPDAHRRGDDDLGQELFRRMLRHIADMKGIVDHVQVFVALLGSGSRYDSGFDGAGLNALAEFFAGQIAYEDALVCHDGLLAAVGAEDVDRR